ncbi:MAG: hypothetical protein HY606_03995 [Planctomycetes bacterium]|nr:hypothetical protein [Planctomycetota bacterium]
MDELKLKPLKYYKVPYAVIKKHQSPSEKRQGTLFFDLTIIISSLFNIGTLFPNNSTYYALRKSLKMPLFLI